MFKKVSIILVLCAFVLVLSGCATIKGAAEGFKEDCKVAKKADDWVRKNLW